MKIYDGIPAAAGRPARVTVTGEAVAPLPVRSEMQYYAASVAWGHGANTTRQLAFAILFDVFGDKRRAAALSARFRDHIFAALPASEPWTLTARQIERIAESFESFRLGEVIAGHRNGATLEGRL